MYCQLNSLCVEMAWFNCCTLITQCATGVQPHPAPKSNWARCGCRHPHTHSHTLFCMFNGNLTWKRQAKSMLKTFRNTFYLHKSSYNYIYYSSSIICVTKPGYLLLNRDNIYNYSRYKIMRERKTIFRWAGCL